MVTLICPQCGVSFDCQTGAANRASKSGAPRYCGKVCSGLGRRKNKTTGQRKAEKSAYDANRRLKLADKIKAEKAAHYQRTRDPKKEAEKRKERMPRHVEYCRRPEYVAWKSGYDREYRAKKEYGEFWEAAILAQSIRDECLAMADDTEIRRQSGTLNKKQQRRKYYERTHGNQSEIGALGNPSSDQDGQHAARRG